MGNNIKPCIRLFIIVLCLNMSMSAFNISITNTSTTWLDAMSANATCELFGRNFNSDYNFSKPFQYSSQIPENTTAWIGAQIIQTNWVSRQGCKFGRLHNETNGSVDNIQDIYDYCQHKCGTKFLIHNSSCLCSSEVELSNETCFPSQCNMESPFDKMFTVCGTQVTKDVSNNTVYCMCVFNVIHRDEASMYINDTKTSSVDECVSVSFALKSGNASTSSLYTTVYHIENCNMYNGVVCGNSSQPALVNASSTWVGAIDVCRNSTEDGLVGELFSQNETQVDSKNKFWVAISRASVFTWGSVPPLGNNSINYSQMCVAISKNSHGNESYLYLDCTDILPSLCIVTQSIETATSTSISTSSPTEISTEVYTQRTTILTGVILQPTFDTNTIIAIAVGVAVFFIVFVVCMFCLLRHKTQDNVSRCDSSSGHEYKSGEFHPTKILGSFATNNRPNIIPSPPPLTDHGKDEQHIQMDIYNHLTDDTESVSKQNLIANDYDSTQPSSNTDEQTNQDNIYNHLDTNNTHVSVIENEYDGSEQNQQGTDINTDNQKDIYSHLEGDQPLEVPTSDPSSNYDTMDGLVTEPSQGTTKNDESLYDKVDGEVKENSSDVPNEEELNESLNTSYDTMEGILMKSSTTEEPHASTDTVDD